MIIIIVALSVSSKLERPVRRNAGERGGTFVYAETGTRWQGIGVLSRGEPDLCRATFTKHARACYLLS